MADHTPQTPRQRAAVDLTAALVAMEEVADTLRGAGHHEWALDAKSITSWLETLKAAVEGA